MKIPKKHDHVGHMIYGKKQAFCTKCKQKWKFVKDKGWIPV